MASDNTVTEKGFWDELEPHQLEDMFLEDDVPLLPISKKVTNNLVRLGLGLVVLMLVAASTVQIPRQVNLDFEIRGGGTENIFQYPEPISIRQKWINSGDTIKTGDKMIMISSPTISSLANRLETARESYEIFQNEEQALHLTNLQANQQQIWASMRELSQVRSTLEKYSAIKDSAAKEMIKQDDLDDRRLERMKILHKNEAVSDLDLEDTERSVADQKSDRNSQMALYETTFNNLRVRETRLTREINDLTNEIETQNLQRAKDSADITTEMLNLHREIVNRYGEYLLSNGNVILLAPGDGVVLFVNESESELPSSAIAIRLLREKGSLFAYSNAPPEHIGKLEIGQEAVLKLSSFPYYEYGAVYGKIAEIGQAPEGSSLYPIVIDLVDLRQLDGRLVKGMQGDANVITDERTLVQQAFYKIVKAANFE